MKKLLLSILMLCSIIAYGQTHTICLMGKGLRNDSVNKWEDVKSYDSVRILVGLNRQRLIFYGETPGEFQLGKLISMKQDSLGVANIFEGYDKVKDVKCTIWITRTKAYPQYRGFSVYYEKYYMMFLLLPYEEPNKAL